MVTINYFQNATDLRTFWPDQIIFKEGEPGDVMYIVVEGSIDIMVGGKLIETLRKGSILGEMALVGEDPTRSATAIARETSRLKAINQQYFTYLMQQMPYFGLQVMGIMAQRLRQANSHLV